MAKKTRLDLQALFQEGVMPSNQAYKDLIESTLNKLDDKFFGHWKSGTYRYGDVVIWQKTIYVCIVGEGSGTKKNTNDTNLSGEALFCSIKSPDRDPENWQQVEVHVEDGDWKLSHDKNKMHALTKYVGIGTDDPQSSLHIEKTEKGKILLVPENDPGPLIQIADQQAGDYLTLALCNQQAELVAGTNEGFEVRLETKTGMIVEQTHSLKLMKDQDKNPLAGLGTATPQASLDVHQEERGKFQVHTNGRPEANYNLIDKNDIYLSGSIESNTSLFTTNAAKGYQYRANQSSFVEFCQEFSAETTIDNKVVLSITADGKLGINVVEPELRVEAQTDHGKFLLSLGEKGPSPAQAIVNIRRNPQYKENYYTLGADHQYAIQVTDAMQGFVFKKGDPNQELNIDGTGVPLVNIKPDGKMGIGKLGADINYEADVLGCVRALNFYIDSSAANRVEEKPIEEVYDQGVLDEILKIQPIIIKWKSELPCRGDQYQFGFKFSEINQNLGQAADANHDAISYQALVPVLFQAVKELSAKLEMQQSLIEDLKNNL